MEALARPDALHGLILIRDSILADASHRVVSSLLRTLLLTNDVNVLMVASRHSTAHYSTLLRRLNLNVSRIAADGRFKVLNTNSLCRLDLATGRFMVKLNTLMDAVVSDVSNQVTGRDQGQRRCAVLFDDVVALLSTCGADPLSACRALAGVLPKTVFCRILVVHEDVDDMGNALMALSHEASTVVTLKSLASGISGDVEAQVEILRRKLAPGCNDRLGVVEEAIKRHSV